VIDSMVASSVTGTSHLKSQHVMLKVGIYQLNLIFKRTSLKKNIIFHLNNSNFTFTDPFKPRERWSQRLPDVCPKQKQDSFNS
jgi:hypothetical protein